MTKLVVILNGPPNSGKDFITRELIKHLVLTDLSVDFLEFKTALYRETASQYYIPYYDFVHLASHRATKDIPNERLGGLTPRQAMIETSENYIKPLYGKEFFAEALLEKIDDKDIYIIPDGGFKEEAQALIDSPKIDKVMLVHLTAPGTSFAGDSRYQVLDSMLHNHKNKLIIQPIFNNKKDHSAVIFLLNSIYQICSYLPK